VKDDARFTTIKAALLKHASIADRDERQAALEADGVSLSDLDWFIKQDEKIGRKMRKAETAARRR
jgi:hypothetical protein